MGKKKKAFSKYKWIKAYKNYVLEHGELVDRVKDLADFAGQSRKDFKQQFNSLVQLEAAVILLYFKKANDLLVADKKFHTYSSKDKQLAFLYVLIEQVSGDEVFLHEFQHLKMWDKSFAIRLYKMLHDQELGWSNTMSWGDGAFEKLGINPKKSALIHHALTTIAFFLKDDSHEKQDTDAYIEKTTDLLFRLTDTSTIRSVVDLGRFLVSRRKAAFSWD